MIAVDDVVKITIGALKGMRGQVLKIEEGIASVQTRVGVVVIAVNALEAA